jgi:hypothetical protein
MSLICMPLAANDAMPRGLNAVLKTLQNASKSRNDKKFTATIDEVATLVKLVVSHASVACRRVWLFDLYLLPL